ncbi:MAG: 3-phosphoshikimate 1-carboxyvinyltransferase, partial [Firmicutes bacterium]|nr:3-phosphoshikimate 1-carboxyvinyltransferase [Bacillota bacterium]
MFRGTIRVPGDKSITHRALILAALAEGTSEVFGPLRSDDCRSTVNCLRRLGVQIAEFPDKTVVEGLGMTGLVSPEAPLDCGNSGTTMRLLAGVLAAQPFVSVLTGDDSLNTRPMGRIVEPLKQMGALIKGRQYDQFAPLVIRGGSLQGITYELPTASAQVKSAILLAGLNAEGETRLRGRIDSRDHSERMLAVFGADIDTTDEEIVLRPGHSLKAQTVHIPGDISSAAFFIAAAAAVPGSYLEVEDVGLNPTRTGFVDVLQAMGADIEVLYEHDLAGEPVGRIVVRGRELEGTVIDGKLIPRVIDEL